jgi:hypothetical protein
MPPAVNLSANSSLRYVVHTAQVTPSSRVLLEELTVAQLGKKFLAVYGTRKLTAGPATVRTLSQVSYIIPQRKDKIYRCTPNDYFHLPFFLTTKYSLSSFYFISFLHFAAFDYLTPEIHLHII